MGKLVCGACRTIQYLLKLLIFCGIRVLNLQCFTEIVNTIHAL